MAKSILKAFPRQAVIGVGIVFPLIGTAVFVIGLCFGDLTAVAIGLAFYSAGIATLSSYKGMKATANSKFHEKIAVMAEYMRTFQSSESKHDHLSARRVEHDLRAALAWKGWANRDLKEEFKTSLQEFIDLLKKNGITDCELCSKLQKIKFEIDR
ncbi:MAG: hypothetical protein IBX36_01350 [Dehalococcoidia bacterium]|nr:hypothetical protein [Dehalococcoidia bacterium]